MAEDDLLAMIPCRFREFFQIDAANAALHQRQKGKV
jgi:hypothetical protein